MTGVIGLDLQTGFSVVAVREAEVARPALVGDGRRRLVPNVMAGALWGTAAAEAGGPTCDPWGRPFLTGLRERVERYLGMAAGELQGHGYRTAVCVRPGMSGGLAGAFRDAGLGTPILVSEPDALVCQWLAAGSMPVRRTSLLSIVCAERRTTAACYQVTGGGQRLHQLGRVRELDVGGRSWPELITEEVLARLPEGVAPSDPATLLDGALETAAALELRAVVSWQGAHAEALRPRLNVHRDDLARRSEVADVVADVVDLVRRLAIEPVALILLGGLGGHWPFLGAALAEIAPVWRGPDPVVDLALGAALRPGMTHRFDSALTPIAPNRRTALAGSEPAGPTPHLTDTEEELPPWKR